MRLDLLEGVRTRQWSGLHPSHASGITDTLIDMVAAPDRATPTDGPCGRRRPCQVSAGKACSSAGEVGHEHQLLGCPVGVADQQLIGIVPGGLGTLGRAARTGRCQTVAASGSPAGIGAAVGRDSSRRLGRAEGIAVGVGAELLPWASSYRWAAEGQVTRPGPVVRRPVGRV
jgi:hypothetical protein